MINHVVRIVVTEASNGVVRRVCNLQAAHRDIIKGCLGEKGCMSINKASEERGDTTYLLYTRRAGTQECRRKYCKPEQIVNDLQKKDQAQEGTVLPAQKQVLRSAERPFNFSTHCFSVANLP